LHRGASGGEVLIQGWNHGGCQRDWLIRERLENEDGHVACNGFLVCECKDCATWHLLIGAGL